MSKDIAFPDIDTSYWKTKDPEWMTERKAQWPRIEAMLKGPKSGKGKTAIKQYFLKGKMPDWEKFADWDNSERHVDLFMFLWLHPSWDERVLVPLRDAYMASEAIILDDLKAGFGNLLSWGTVMACQDYTGLGEEELRYGLHTDGHNELLFKIMMGNLNQTAYEIARPVKYGPKEVFHIPKSKLFTIHTMSRWLCVKTMYPINNDMLFQYDQPLEWWYQSCTKDEDYFLKEAQEQVVRNIIEKALWRIHNFDTEKEGPGPRTTFVHKIRKILDERTFIKDVENMWQRVKSDEVRPDDPWDIRS